MTKEGDDLDGDTLFRRTMDSLGVKPAKVVDSRVLHDASPVTAKIRRSGKAALDYKTPAMPTIDRTDPDDTVLFVRAGVDRSRWKALRRGQIMPQESLDLHGLRSHEVEGVLERFVGECLGQGLKSLLIIHGKGRGSEIRGGILKPLTIEWLRRQADVVAFCEAQPADGGRGALYVLLSTR